DAAGADQDVRNLERLLSGVRLRHDEVVGVHAELLRILGVERVLSVDEGSGSTSLLRVGDSVQRDSGLTGGFGSVDLDNATAGKPADAKSDVQRDRARGNRL